MESKENPELLPFNEKLKHFQNQGAPPSTLQKVMIILISLIVNLCTFELCF